MSIYTRELAAVFRANIPSAQLSFALAIAPKGQTSHYNHSELAAVLDFIVPMAYDENWGALTVSGGSVAGIMVGGRRGGGMGCVEGLRRDYRG
jgi:spore germination protein YaaH